MTSFNPKKSGVPEGKIEAIAIFLAMKRKIDPCQQSSLIDFAQQNKSTTTTMGQSFLRIIGLFYE